MFNWEKKLDHDVIDGFRDAISSFAKDREKELSQEYGAIDKSRFESEFDYESYKSHLEGEGSFLGEIYELRNELVILALYKKIELKRKRILKTAYPNLVEKSYLILTT